MTEAGIVGEPVGRVVAVNRGRGVSVELTSVTVGKLVSTGIDVGVVVD